MKTCFLPAKRKGSWISKSIHTSTTMTETLMSHISFKTKYFIKLMTNINAICRRIIFTRMNKLKFIKYKIKRYLSCIQPNEQALPLHKMKRKQWQV